MTVTATLQHHRPRTLAEACELGRELGARAVYLAGGTELVPPANVAGRLPGEHLISLRELDALRGVQQEADGTLRVGAMTTLAELTREPLVAEHCPALAETARLMAGEQVRTLATVGGNFCAAVACADLPPVCLALEATLAVQGADGERRLPVEKFIRGPRRTVLQPGELLTALCIPPQPKGSGTTTQRFSLRRGNALAVASVCARLTVENGQIREARLALGAVAPVPRLVPAVHELLAGKPTDAALFETAAQAASEAAQPISDVRASAAFRHQLVQRLAKRALEEAVQRASAPTTEGAA